MAGLLNKKNQQLIADSDGLWQKKAILGFRGVTSCRPVAYVSLYPLPVEGYKQLNDILPMSHL